ncbi:MAG TPA: hypothetical protein VK522_04480 [Pseudolabrys sp.]|nr:hypothetical protein [Pseudolabrys sp.]
MPARIEIAAELIAEGKILYEQTDTSILEICARMGISRNVLYARIDRWKWQRRRYTSGSGAGAEPSDAPAVTACSTQAEAEDSALEPPEVFYARVCRGVQRQMAIVERVQTGLLPAGAVPSERSVRILATINKVLLEIEATAKPHKVPDEPDDSMPRDIEEFRAQLAQRIKALVDAEHRRSGEGAGSDSAE